MKLIFILIFVLLQFFGVDIKPIYTKIEKSINLFTTFKQPSIFQSECKIEKTLKIFNFSEN